MKISELQLKTIKGRNITINESKSGLGIDSVIVEGVGELKALALTSCVGEEIINSLYLPDNLREKIKKDKTYTGVQLADLDLGVIILDEESGDILKDFRKKELRGKIIKEIEEAKIRKAKREAKYVGMSEIRKAYADWSYYQNQLNLAMEDEYNDGVNMPTPPTSNIEELTKKYPVATMYLKAESYSFSDNYNKSLAGKKAMTLLDEGGSIEEAQEILDNWLQNSVYLD